LGSQLSSSHNNIFSNDYDLLKPAQTFANHLLT
jgi:hypothetical protein